MEDFYYAGGMKALLARLREGQLLHLDTMSVTGQTLGDNIKDADRKSTRLNSIHSSVSRMPSSA